MNVTIVSAFRNSASYIPDYFQRVNALEPKPHLVLGYGDNADSTQELLQVYLLDYFSYSLVDVSHGGQHYGSIVHPERFRQLAGVWNTLWKKIPADADIVAMVESDLVWEPQCLSNLIEGVRYLQKRFSSGILLAPRINLPDGRFYDTWGFAANGRNFINRPPHHRELVNPPHYLEMDSVGSFVVMDGETARKLRWPKEDVVVGLCRMAKKKGARIFMDTQERVVHPL